MVEHARVSNERMPRMRALVLAHHHPRADQRSIGVLLKPRDPSPRRVNLVVIDAASGRPLQALALGC